MSSHLLSHILKFGQGLVGIVVCGWWLLVETTAGVHDHKTHTLAPCVDTKLPDNMVTEFHQGSQQGEWNVRYLSTWPQKSHSHFCHIPGQGHHKGLPRFKGGLNDLINWWDGCKLYRKGMWNITYHRGHIYKIALATVRHGSWDFTSLVTRWSQCCWYCVWA